jgi:hypothetical protein
VGRFTLASLVCGQRRHSGRQAAQHSGHLVEFSVVALALGLIVPDLRLELSLYVGLDLLGAECQILDQRQLEPSPTSSAELVQVSKGRSSEKSASISRLRQLVGKAESGHSMIVRGEMF